MCRSKIKEYHYKVIFSNYVFYVCMDVRMPNISGGTAEVSCPEGTEVTGGYDLRSESNVEVHQILNTPENLLTENGWRTTVQVSAVSDEVILLLTVYAVCGTLVDPT
jgi:hypothetical protein